MGTNNPKVSAYVPQPLKARLNAYRKENNNISESYAVTIILAHYFGMEQMISSTSETIAAGVTLARIEALEKEVQSLKSSELPSNSLSNLQNLERLVAQIENRLSSVEAKQSSELNLGLQSEPLEIERKDNSVKQLSILENTEDPSEGDHDQAVSEEVQQVKDSGISEPTEGLPSEPKTDVAFNIDRLAKRLGTTAGYISKVKTRDKDDKQKFLDWIQSKDPDKIRWVEVLSKKRSILYKPADDTLSELLSKLQEWIGKNLQ